jgi:hypothetical protein
MTPPEEQRKTFLKVNISQVWWCTSVILAFRRLRQGFLSLRPAWVVE